MLQSRVILSVVLITLVAGLAWLDFHYARPGLILAPLAFLGAVLGGNELVRLLEHSGKIDPLTGRALDSPSRYVVSTTASMLVLTSLMPTLIGMKYTAPLTRAGLIGLGMLMLILVLFVVEMIRFKGAGSATNRLARGLLAAGYAGGMISCLVLLRTLAGPSWGGASWGDDGRWGMLALLSMIAVVKACDTGAYVFGHMLGRHKMTPSLSPGKTWEGAIGGVASAVAMAFVFLGPLARSWGLQTDQPQLTWATGVVLYGLLVALAGILGDLAVSMMKRDAALKNSSTWMPGFGGVLDTLDSILLAAPVAYILWLARVVGP
ncbi:Phosphatidate cytidylyltransferase [Pirellulimonas nuda]|uniref:Phosphatidate cytidylyltransferase n=1 Tax=Pirellulimonas nuda TaxID=2528009 RepID=A0A518D6D1_9BACT|nr:phosphatidate cytidylyltransferase [Pirellulimonas nuda]QDU87027.1 Phosphatidate cytidylyltransferase [Pirellulimonas nuda]